MAVYLLHVAIWRMQVHHYVERELPGLSIGRHTELEPVTSEGVSESGNNWGNDQQYPNSGRTEVEVWERCKIHQRNLGRNPDRPTFFPIL